MVNSLFLLSSIILAFAFFTTSYPQFGLLIIAIPLVSFIGKKISSVDTSSRKTSYRATNNRIEIIEKNEVIKSIPRETIQSVELTSRTVYTGDLSSKLIEIYNIVFKDSNNTIIKKLEFRKYDPAKKLLDEMIEQKYPVDFDQNKMEETRRKVEEYKEKVGRFFPHQNKEMAKLITNGVQILLTSIFLIITIGIIISKFR